MKNEVIISTVKTYLHCAHPFFPSVSLFCSHSGLPSNGQNVSLFVSNFIFQCWRSNESGCRTKKTDNTIFFLFCISNKWITNNNASMMMLMPLHFNQRQQWEWEWNGYCSANKTKTVHHRLWIYIENNYFDYLCVARFASKRFSFSSVAFVIIPFFCCCCCSFRICVKCAEPEKEKLTIRTILHT